MPKTKKKSVRKSARTNRTCVVAAVADIDVPELTPSQKRVQLAQDIAQQIILRRYRGTIGNVIGHDTTRDVMTQRFGLGANTTLQQALKATKQCKVCAKGACFIAYVERFNNVTYAEFENAQCPGYTHTIAGFSDVFPPRLLAEMETLFERAVFGLAQKYLGGSLAERVKQHSLDKYSKDKDARLLEIMLKLIEHEGNYIEFPEVADQIVA